MFSSENRNCGFFSRDAVVLCRFWKIYHQAERIATLAKAENVKNDSYWPPLFAKLVEKKNVDDLILSVGSAFA